ncbi:hypothetical protein [Burkholderia pseudomallei]|uniref:hypothetical protein n=1 Tax=Burkholderia pseudomallei TaxID=28450 RepID=UPI001300AAD3|nr:hypothetical protein [Burkholderia pseudomallei]QGS95130.1 hypothetical protein R15_25865 [Burkholderia pseudomallei]
MLFMLTPVDVVARATSFLSRGRSRGRGAPTGRTPRPPFFRPLGESAGESGVSGKA